MAFRLPFPLTGHLRSALEPMIHLRPYIGQIVGVALFHITRVIFFPCAAFACARSAYKAAWGTVGGC